MLSMVLRGVPRSDRFGNPNLLIGSERSMPLDLTRSHAAFAASLACASTAWLKVSLARRLRHTSHVSLVSQRLKPGITFSRAFLSSSAHFTHFRISLIFDTGVSLDTATRPKLPLSHLCSNASSSKFGALADQARASSLNSSGSRSPSLIAAKTATQRPYSVSAGNFSRNPASSSTVPSQVSRRSSVSSSSSSKSASNTGFSGFLPITWPRVGEAFGSFSQPCAFASASNSSQIARAAGRSISFRSKLASWLSGLSPFGHVNGLPVPGWVPKATNC